MPTQTFYMLSTNVGMALGKHELSGMLYLDSDKCEKKNAASPFLYQYGDLLKFSALGIASVALLGYLMQENQALDVKTHSPNIQLARNRNAALPSDLYEIGDVSEDTHE